MLGDAEILYTLWFPTRLEPDAVPIGEYCIFAMGLLARGLLGFYRDQQQRVRNRAHSTLTDLTGIDRWHRGLRANRSARCPLVAGVQHASPGQQAQSRPA